jgi:hypothetical protein
MGERNDQTSGSISDRVVSILLSLPWVEILTEAWKTGREFLQGMVNEGMYEVLEYVCIGCRSIAQI